jgi:hypothetical protein
LVDAQTSKVAQPPVQVYLRPLPDVPPPVADAFLPQFQPLPPVQDAAQEFLMVVALELP